MEGVLAFYSSFMNWFGSLYMLMSTVGVHSLRLFGQRIKAVSFDVTGTLMVHRFPIMDTYARCAAEARLCSDPPTSSELKPAFRQAYKEILTKYPCFGSKSTSEREWWRKTVLRAVELTGKTGYTDRDFERFFRRVYQHYGGLDGYEVLDDTLPLLDFLKKAGVDNIGVTTNTPLRTIETVLPMMGLSDQMRFFTCCQDVGHEKPAPEIFAESFEQICFESGQVLDKKEVLHIGDSFAADYCGARAFGFSSLFLDRSNNSRVTVYQDWLEAPPYEGKSDADIRKHTVSSLREVQTLFVS